MRTGTRKTILIQLAIVVAILLGGELALRVWAGAFRHSYQRYDAELGMIGLVPNYDADTYGGRVRINSLGFRGGEFIPVKPPGTFRIIMIGDSATFGLSGEECHYPGVLNKLLESRNGSRRVEVINAGVEGYDSESALRLLEKRIVRYKPDLIGVYIGWNDMVKRDPVNPNASGKHQWLAYRTYDVYLIRFWRKVLYHQIRPLMLSVGREVAPEEEVAYRRYVPSIFKHNLEQMAEIAKRAGARMVFLTLPSPLRDDMEPEEIKKLYFPYYTFNLKRFVLVYQRYNEVIRETAGEEGMPVIDLAAKFAGRGRLFMDTSHATCEGHAVLAQEIYGGLLELGIVPG